MKTLGFVVLDVFGFFMLVGPTMEIGPCATQAFGPNRPIDIAFFIAGLLLFFLVGYAAPPRKDTYGSFRGVAMVVFMLAAISLPENIYLFLHNLRYSRTPAALFDPSDVTRGLIRGFSAFAFLVIGLWVWHRPGEAPGNRGIEASPKR